MRRDQEAEVAEKKIIAAGRALLNGKRSVHTCLYWRLTYIDVIHVTDVQAWYELMCNLKG